MDRRNIFQSLIAVGAGIFAAPARGEDAAVPRVVYHLADLDKVEQMSDLLTTAS